MSGIISTTTNILSSITLALLEDSGWYQANYTNSRMSPWGLGAGCEFVEEPCLSTQNGQAVVPEWGRGEFCSTQGERACSAELSHKMSCWVRDYADFIPQTLPPTSMQYFPGQPTLGGPQRADFCPVYAATYQNQQVSELDCRNTANGGTAFNVHKYVYTVILAAIWASQNSNTEILPIVKFMDLKVAAFHLRPAKVDVTGQHA